MKKRLVKLNDGTEVTLNGKQCAAYNAYIEASSSELKNDLHSKNEDAFKKEINEIVNIKASKIVKLNDGTEVTLNGMQCAAYNAYIEASSSELKNDLHSKNEDAFKKEINEIVNIKTSKIVKLNDGTEVTLNGKQYTAYNAYIKASSSELKNDLHSKNEDAFKKEINEIVQLKRKSKKRYFSDSFTGKPEKEEELLENTNLKNPKLNLNSAQILENVQNPVSLKSGLSTLFQTKISHRFCESYFF